eukprot:scaffold228_cov56-Cyclotella_meneghiniana.AAC.9
MIAEPVKKAFPNQRRKCTTLFNGAHLLMMLMYFVHMLLEENPRRKKVIIKGGGIRGRNDSIEIRLTIQDGVKLGLDRLLLFTPRLSEFGLIWAVHSIPTLPMFHYKYNEWLGKVEI